MRSVVATVCVLIAYSVASLAQLQVQTGPITEPHGQDEPISAVAKGAAAITTTRSKCTTRLSVNADALFQPHRWTLNPDAPETLDALGPKIVQAGKYPAHIVAYTDASDSEAENRDVSQRRALTVRTWLINHRFVPDDIDIGEYNSDKPVAAAGKIAWRKQHARDNGSVSVVIDACH